MSAEEVHQMAVREELPEDLLRIILSMLPVKSLMRFKCVRKSWYALIKSPNFIDLHLKNRSSSSTDSDCVIVNRFLEHHNRFVLSFFSNETLDDLSINIDTPFSKRELSLIILGPCNGLICITDYHDIVLCNPSIREFKSLTVPPIFGNPDKMVHSPRGVGFGFDPISGDYKVVRIVNHFYDDDDDDGYYKAEVYNLSTNSWRELNATVPAHVSHFPCFETLFNGAFHWYANIDSSVHECCILSFNFSNEVMQLIPLPDIYSIPDGHYCRLAIINESLALILYENLWYWCGLVEKHFDIWVMNEYGVRESWTRLFKIGPLLGIEYPLVFWKNSELLLESSNGQLVSCDLQHQNVKHFPIHGVPSIPRVQITLGVVTSYSESLVSVNVKNEREESA